MVARVSAEGEWEWVITGGGTGNDQVGFLPLSLFPDGGVLVTGYSQSPSPTFGALSLPANRAFVAKVSQDGEWEWVTPAGGESPYTGHAPVAEVTPDGTARVAGRFIGPSAFGAAGTLNGNGSTDGFIGSLNSNGTWNWVEGVGGTGLDNIAKMDTYANGDAVVYGSMVGTITVGAGGAQHTAPGSGYIFVAKIDNDGEWIWSNITGPVLAPSIREGLVATNDGGAVLSLRFNGTQTLSPHTVSAVGGTDVSVSYIDSNGAWQWATRIGTSGTETLDSLTPTASGMPVVTSTLANGTAQFGSTPFSTPSGYAATVMARPDGNGGWEWINSVSLTSNSGYIWGDGNALLPDGTVAISGGYGGSTIQINDSNPNVTNIDGDSAFVLRMRPDGSLVGPLPVGLPTTVTVNATDSEGSVASTTVTITAD